MAYFLGRDVDVYVTLETVGVGSPSGVAVSTTDSVDLVANASALIPAMESNALVLSGAVTDVTGVDLSIGVSDEDVGPFFGQLATQKIEIRKETTVSLTRKKSNTDWDVIFNGPTVAGEFYGSAANAARMGARFGAEYSGTTMMVSQGLVNPTGVLETGSTTTSCYGYRIHLRMKDGDTGEVFTVRNCAYTGHTVSLNADGTSEETMEFTASMTPYVYTPTGSDDFYRTITPVAQM